MSGLPFLLVGLLAAVANGQSETTYAHCKMTPAAADISGGVVFRQVPGEDLEIRVNLTGLNKNDGIFLHGLHVHEFGDLSDGCDAMEGHWDPYNTPHGAPTDLPYRRHIGDFGNMPEDGNGGIHFAFTDYLATLSEENNIVGHGLVLHEHYDDLGRSDDEDSLVNGNAGSRLACCVIGYSDDRHFS